MAVLYDYWFVQFDFPDKNGMPYKSSGGKMKWSEELKREIPEKWEARQLKTILKKNIAAFDCASVQPTIDLSVMPSGSLNLSKLNTSKEFSTNLMKMSKGDLLFGGIRPYLKKAGIAPCDGAVAGTVRSFFPISSSDYNFALFTLVSESMFSYAVQVSTGTRMPTVTSDALLDRWVPYNSAIAERFNAYNVRDLIVTNIQESTRLQSLRDWLLPMLMNGQASVKPQQPNYRLSNVFLFDFNLLRASVLISQKVN